MNWISIGSDNDLDLTNKIQWKLNKNTKVFIQENALENVVCEMAAILFRGDELKRLNNDTWPDNWEENIHTHQICFTTIREIGSRMKD